MTLVSQLAALAAIVGTGRVYGTDVFCALVQRPALARVDAATLTAVMGTCTASQTAACPPQESSVSPQPPPSPQQPTGTTAAATAAAAFLLLVGWLVLYLRISAPVNRTLRAAADAHETPSNARAPHADPRTTMRYDRARGSLDRHATCIVATYVAGAAR